MYRTGPQGYDIAVNATLREKRTVKTAFGNKTLYIFVEDQMWKKDIQHQIGYNEYVTVGIDETFVKDQADAFLKEGEFNDIYDYVTDIFGEEYGPTAGAYSSGLIPETNEIVIFFTQIGNATNTNSGTAGYFDSYSYYQSSDSSGTNESLCLIMNAYMSAGDRGMSKTTMAHEFQHAIFDYQRLRENDLGGESEPTWINEMFSALAEEVVAKYLGARGPAEINHSTGTVTAYGEKDGATDPRGERNGRIGEYLAGQMFDVTDWEGVSSVHGLIPYGLVYSLGSYILRNYGIGFIEKYMDTDTRVTKDNDQERLIAAIKGTDSSLSSLTWGQLINDWGVAIINSDKNLAKPYRLNTNGYIIDANNDKIPVPSLNYFKYYLCDENFIGASVPLYPGGANLKTKGPQIYNMFTDRLYSSVSGQSWLKPNTNTYVLLEKGVTEDKSYSIENVVGLKYTIVIK